MQQPENKSTSNQPRVLIIEDEPGMVAFIQIGLEYEGYTSLVAADGETGLRMALQERPDLIILDLMLPEMSGFEVCKRLRQFSEVPVIMLTAKFELESRVQGLDQGADDYITKPFQFKELAARIRAVLRRKNWNKDENSLPPLQIQDVRLDPVSRLVWRNNRQLELSMREFDLLHFLMGRPNQILTRDIILEQVWGYKYDGDSNIVDVYIRYLRNKLGEPEFISTVRGMGYIIRSENS